MITLLYKCLRISKKTPCKNSLQIIRNGSIISSAFVNTDSAVFKQNSASEISYKLSKWENIIDWKISPKKIFFMKEIIQKNGKYSGLGNLVY